MAKLYFYYSTMNAGKSTLLLQSRYNYEESGMHTVVLSPKIDDRFEANHVVSRIGLKAPAIGFDANDDLFNIVAHQHEKQTINCLFIDEAQFLTKAQVFQLTEIVDELNIPTLAYGIRNDFQSEPFEGSIYLLTWADELAEVKTICHCGRKANHVVRQDAKGNVMKAGSQIEIGGNDKYVSLCRKHFKEVYYTDEKTARLNQEGR